MRGISCIGLLLLLPVAKEARVWECRVNVLNHHNGAEAYLQVWTWRWVEGTVIGGGDGMDGGNCDGSRGWRWVEGMEWMEWMEGTVMGGGDGDGWREL